MDFNSIKVRLEPPFNDEFVEFKTFQFHKGAIRTYLCSRFDWFLLISIP